MGAGVPIAREESYKYAKRENKNRPSDAGLKLETRG